MQDYSKETIMDDDSLLLDKPIQLDSEDKLERSKIVDAIMDRVLSHTSKDSITIGIEGSWGSGKTSVINLVMDRIIKKYKPDIWENYDSYVFSSTTPSKISPLIVNFNPWIYSNEEKLLSDFFRLICHSITLRNKWLAIAFWFSTSEYINKILETSKLGLVTSVFLGTVEVTVNIFSILNVLLNTPIRFQLNNKKSRADKILGELNEKIFVFIDDIDRLDADETLLILKLTKIVADFPNMVFILAYDKDKTIKKIDTKFEGNIKSKEAHNYEDIGDNFIDKIVQYHFHIPKTHRFNYEKYFSELVESINKYSNVEILDKDTLNSAYKDYLYALLQTPRNAKQYIKNITTRLSIIDVKEICLQDLLLIEAVRIYAIDTYNSLHDNILELVHHEIIYDTNRNRDAVSYNNLLEKICDKALATNKDSITKILSNLFPFHIGKYEDARRICSKAHYDKYFTMLLDPTKISEEEIEIFANKLYEGNDAFVEYVNNFRGIEYLNRVIACKKIINAIDDNDNIRLTNLLLSLWELSETDVWPLNLWCLNTQEQHAWYFECSILYKLDYASKKKVLFSAIESINIRHSYLYFLYRLSKPEEQKTLNKLLTADDMNELRRRCIKELESDSITSWALTNRGILEITLNFWFEYGKKNDIQMAKKFALSLLKSKDTLIKLLENYIDDISTRVRFDRNKLSKYFDDITVVDNEVTKLDKNKLTQEERDIVDMYKNALNSN